MAGAEREIFAADTFEEIFRYTGGVPRLINTLCDTAMMAAYVDNRETVGRAQIVGAVQELRWPEYAARTRAAEPPPTVAAAPGAPQPIARLLVATDGRTVQEIPLQIGRLIIGRTPDNDVQIDSRFVSRHHCQIITSTQSCVVEDLNSTNGTFVKSNRVRRHYLNDGDVVTIGKHELIYMDERAARARAKLTDTVPGI